MSNRVWAASHKRALELAEAGCPIDYFEATPLRAERKRGIFHAEQLDGYAESRIYLVGPLQVGYLVGLRLWTDRSTVIADWCFEPPWPEHAARLDFDPWEFVPATDRGSYRELFNSRLLGVLNEHRLLRRGAPIEGLLCGYSYQPVPEIFGPFVSAKLTLKDDVGNQVVLGISMTVVRARRMVSRPRHDPALEKRLGGK